MKTLRDYEQLIREEVKKISDKDPNWNFSVRSIADDHVKIYWTYLRGESHDCFLLTLSDYDEEDNDQWISAKTPHGEMIEGYFCSDNLDKKSWQSSYENAIKYAIEEIAYYAHSRY